MSKRAREDSAAPAEEQDAKKMKLTTLGEKNSYDATKQYKFISWNVNGLKALMGKDDGAHMKDLINEEQPTAIFLQETKLSNNAAAKPFASSLKGYTGHLNHCTSKNGYSGTAVYIRNDGPKVVKVDFKKINDNEEGRTITVEYEDVFAVGCYIPNSGQKLERLKYRTTEWDPEMLEYLKSLQEKKPVIWCGDLNVAILDIDVHDPKRNKRTAGFTDEERGEFRKVLNEEKFIDSFREFKANDKEQYTYWGYRNSMRSKNKGWRLDYFICSQSLKSNIVNSYILKDVLGSDHCPIALIVNKPGSTSEAASSAAESSSEASTSTSK